MSRQQRESFEGVSAVPVEISAEQEDDLDGEVFVELSGQTHFRE